MHNACMPSVTVRNVPEDTRAELAARAARAGRSLQEYLLGELIGLAARPDVGALMEDVRARKAAHGTKLTPKTILAHRDAGRR
jgi:hypothetical protein